MAPSHAHRIRTAILLGANKALAYPFENRRRPLRAVTAASGILAPLGNLAGVWIRTAKHLVTAATLVCVAVVDETAAPGRGDALDIGFTRETLGVAVGGNSSPIVVASPYAALWRLIGRTADWFAAVLEKHVSVSERSNYGNSTRFEFYEAGMVGTYARLLATSGIIPPYYSKSRATCSLHGAVVV